ncbi:hypothetical protein BH23GEM10_BH23GEM10_10010 [soil metagenome]
MMEAHHPTAEQLEALADGALRGADRVTVESHLTGCTACRTAAGEWGALFEALAALPELAPAAGFSDRVMAGARMPAGTRWQQAWQQAWQSAWQQAAVQAGALADRVTPKSTFGWALVAALVALPVVLGGGIVAWLVSNEYVTLDALRSWTTETLVLGLQGIGQTAITTVMPSDVAAWTIARGSEFVGTAGVTGVGAIAATAGMMTMLSVWILYRNLFRTPTREIDYVTYSF